MAQCGGAGRACAHLFYRLRFVAAQAGRLAGAPLSAYHPTWNQGVTKSLPRSGAVISDRLFLYFFGIHTVKERGDGRDKRLGRCGGRRSFHALPPNPRCVITATVPTTGGDTLQRNKSCDERGQIHFHHRYPAEVSA